MAIPAAPAAEQLHVESRLIVNVFCCVLFGLCIVFALLMGCKPKDYWHLLTNRKFVNNFSSTYGNAVFLMNLGVLGLFILAYYNAIGATFNGVTFGIIFCMLSCCNSGSHPGNVWPIMAGYVVGAFGLGWISKAIGGDFTNTVNAQAIAVGLCFASGLSPVSGKYGWFAGLVAAVIHYILVTCVPLLHGGFCLYNGGFTAALTCVLFVPVLERFCKTKEERFALKAQK